MADDNNQELAMEDILSSIKNILEEDEASHSPAASETSSPAEQPATGETSEEILELSPEMRVREDEAALPEAGNETLAEPETVTETAAAEEEKPEEVDLDALLDEPQQEGDVVGSLLQSVGTEDLDSDPFYAETENLPEIETEEIPEAEAEIVEVPEVFTGPEEAAEQPPAEEVAEMTTEELPEEETVESFETADAQAEVSDLPEPQAEQIPEVSSEPEEETQTRIDETPAEEPVAAADDAVDVSASIISNFAKMFSNENAAAEVQPQENALPAEPVSRIGNGAQTIEDVVAGVIRSIIGEEVSQNWRQGADYDALARDEIVRQTKAWLDNNLPQVVEAVVKQEIERVMAKAGAHQ